MQQKESRIYAGSGVSQTPSFIFAERSGRVSIKDPKGMGDFLHIVLAIFAVGVMISFL